jgi:transposase
MIDLQQRYATLIYRRERSYEQAGKLLKVDPRTVKTHVKKFEESDS